MTSRHWLAVFAIWATGLAVLVAGLVVVGSNIRGCFQRLPSAACDAACVAAEHLKCSWPYWGTPNLLVGLIFLVSVSSVVLATFLVYRRARHRGQGTST
jgi:hypothetical protein